MKKLLIILLLAVVVVVVGGIFFLDSVAKGAVETAGTDALGVTTSLDSLSIGILRGEVALGGLAIANPPGYDSQNFFTMKQGATKVTLGSLMGSEIEIPNVTLENIVVNLDKKGGKANYQVILDNVNKGSGGTPPAGGPGKEPPGTPPAEPGRRFVIRELVIRNVEVHATLLPLGGKASRVDATIPEIRLKDVPRTKGGAGMKELTGVVMKAILSAIANKVGNLPKDLSEDLLKGVGPVLEQLGGTVGTVLEGSAKDAEKLVEGLGGLIPGRDKK